MDSHGSFKYALCYQSRSRANKDKFHRQTLECLYLNAMFRGFIKSQYVIHRRLWYIRERIWRVSLSSYPQTTDQTETWYKDVYVASSSNISLTSDWYRIEKLLANVRREIDSTRKSGGNQPRENKKLAHAQCCRSFVHHSNEQDRIKQEIHSAVCFRFRYIFW